MVGLVEQVPVTTRRYNETIIFSNIRTNDNQEPRPQGTNWRECT